MREALLKEIFREYYFEVILHSRDHHKSFYSGFEELIRLVLCHYNVATLQRLATYSFDIGVRSQARLALHFMGHNNPNNEVYDDVRFKP